MWFSTITMLALLIGARLLSVAPSDSDQLLFFMTLVGVLGAACVFAFWYLLAVLLERRPAFRDPAGRWVLIWALAFWLTMMSLGLLNRGSSSFGSALLVGSGWMVAVSGFIGLPFAMMGRRKSSL